MRINFGKSQPQAGLVADVWRSRRAVRRSSANFRSRENWPTVSELMLIDWFTLKIDCEDPRRKLCQRTTTGALLSARRAGGRKKRQK